MRRLEEIPEKQSHKGSQEITCQPLTPEHDSKMKFITSNPLKIQTQRRARKAERNKSSTCTVLLAVLGIHDLIFCCLRTSCGLCSLCALKQKVILGVLPLVLFKGTCKAVKKLNICFPNPSEITAQQHFTWLEDHSQYLSVYSSQAFFKLPKTARIPLPLTAL